MGEFNMLPYCVFLELHYGTPFVKSVWHLKKLLGKVLCDFQVAGKTSTAWRHGKHMTHMASRASDFPRFDNEKSSQKEVPTFMTFTKFLKEVRERHGIIWDVFDIVLLLLMFVSFDAYLLDVLPKKSTLSVLFLTCFLFKQ